MTSSPGSMPPPYEAVICCDHEGRGPVRLPIVDAANFVAEFNRVYGDHGLTIVSTSHDKVKDADKVTV